ncbi:MAG: ABC transporter substrate-binding protein [Candidatus Dormibacteria bacterium]
MMTKGSERMMTKGSERMMTTRLFRALSVPCVLVVVSAVLLSACGTTKVVAPKALVQPPSAIAQSGVLKIGSGLEYPPMEFFNAQNQPVGVDVGIGNAIAKLMGVKVQWVQIAFAGLIPALNANRVDMVMADMNITPARAQVVNFVPYMSDGSSIVVVAGNPQHIESMSDLSGKTVAVQLGTTLQASAEAENQQLKTLNRPQMNILTFPQAPDAMNQLQLGRVSAVLLTTSIAGYYAKQHPTDFYVLPKQFASQPVGIAINKQDPELQKAVQKALSILKQNGTFQKIVDQYFGK